MKASHRAELKMREQGHRAELRDRDAAHCQMTAQIAALKSELRQRSGAIAMSGAGLQGKSSMELQDVIVEVPRQGKMKEDTETVYIDDVYNLGGAQERVQALVTRVSVDRDHMCEILTRVEAMEALPLNLEKTMRLIAAAFSHQMKLRVPAKTADSGESSCRCTPSQQPVRPACPYEKTHERAETEESADLHSASPQRGAGGEEELTWAQSQTRRIRGTSTPKIDCWRPKGGAEPKKTPSRGSGIVSREGADNKGLSRFREAARNHLRRCVCAFATGRIADGSHGRSCRLARRIRMRMMVVEAQ